MGGFGSGRGSRMRACRSKKLKIDSLPALSIPELMNLHKENPNKSFSFDNIMLTVEADSVALKREDLQTFSIRIEAIPCTFGGFRYLGCCPFCRRRVRKLYLHKTFFACRHCFKMGYRTQNYTLSFRMILKRKKVGAQINNNEWEKPKWMRQRTFQKLRSEYLDLDEKEQIANFFSFRNNRQVNQVFDDCPLAVIAIERVLMEKYGIQ
jgi:hypothetical protein